MQQPPVTPLIVELTEPVETVTTEITVGDVLMGALTFSGWIVLGAILLALLFAGLLIWLRRRRPSDSLSGVDAPGVRLDLHLPSR